MCFLQILQEFIWLCKFIETETAPTMNSEVCFSEVITSMHNIFNTLRNMERERSMSSGEFTQKSLIEPIDTSGMRLKKLAIQNQYKL